MARSPTQIMGHDPMAPRRKPTLSDDSDFESDSDVNDALRSASSQEEVDIDEEYAGLSAEELRDEKLHAGDTIEYYSMAFVFGDPRGYRVAKILGIKRREREFPLSLDSQELIPRTLMIKRKLTRRGEELSPGDAVWRKIRTFTLIDGEVQGKTRADRLNEVLKNAVTDAFKSLRPENAAKQNDKTRESSTSSSNKKTTSRPLDIKTFFTSKPAKGSLEAVVTSKSSSSKKQQDMSAFVTKRPRIELTPSSYKHKVREGKSSSDSHNHKDEKRHKRDRSSERHHHRSHKTKVDTKAFIEHIVEQKMDPKTDLDSYLELDRKEKQAVKEFNNEKKAAKEARALEQPARPVSSSSSRSNRMRASDSSDRGRNRKGHIQIRSLHNYNFKAAPRPHPDAKPRVEPAPAASKLNFFMDTENDGAFVRPSSKLEVSQKSSGRDAKDRSRDTGKQPLKKKGLSPKGNNLNTWIHTSKKR